MIRHASATSPLRALFLFQEMRADVGSANGSPPFHTDPFIYASLIKACNKAQAFLEGKSIHCHVIRLGLDYNVNVLNSLVSFYVGSVNLMSYAAVLFGSILEKSVVSVNCMISGYVNRGNLDVGLSLFVKMLSGCFGSNVKPNYVTFVILISGCVESGGCRTGNALHCCCFKIGLDANTEICNALIDLYAKFGCILDAVSVFRDMPTKDLISWNAMIWGYVKSGNCKQAFALFRKMRNEDVGVDRVSFSCLLSACVACKDLCLGRMIHAHVKSIGLESDVSVGTALINMYAKCGNVELARKLFDELSKENVEFWNSMIHAYIENGLAREALKLLDQMKSRDLEPDEVTILGLIMACRDTGELHQGILVHSILENNELFKRSIVLGNALIDMYAKCGSMAKARAVFDRMAQKDVISWTSMIVGHAINGEGVKSLATFKHMCAKKFIPNSVTFIGVLSACDHAGLVDEGRRLYDVMREVYHIKPQIEHCGCVVDMLARAGKIEDAQMFIQKMPMAPNALIWRMLINACRVHGHINLGLNLVTGIAELNTSYDSADSVISSNIYAEAGRWGEVISHRSFMVVRRVPKTAGKSAVSYLTE
ncbi:UNVERIFIED_CONTAM: Pentatricopeptide repeat-containing protein, chloroplastic [Sesamum radiatum]|uniref:Pentatricopeptide repeat-containing protein, chloroplastic n=1 Tax=Sesamum radiatum TaxID=300843 RepID=A0AAW2MYN0_SESRA